jgi:predicted RNA-binding Zn ribbon-like protein
MMRMIEPAPGDELSPALALVNTRYADLGNLFDELEDPGSVPAWLANRAEAPRDLALDSDDLLRVHDLRAAVRELLEARIESRAPHEDVLEALAAVTAAAPGFLRLTSSGGQLAEEWVATGGDAFERALAAIAMDAIALATDERGEQLLACAAPSCTRLLLRDHNRRRWCSTRCGDRVRAAGYRARHRDRGHVPS